MLAEVANGRGGRAVGGVNIVDVGDKYATNDGLVLEVVDEAEKVAGKGGLGGLEARGAVDGAVEAVERGDLKGGLEDVVKLGQQVRRLGRVLEVGAKGYEASTGVNHALQRRPAVGGRC